MFYYVVRSVLSAVLNMHTQPTSAVIVLHIPARLVWQNTLRENLILHIFNLVRFCFGGSLFYLFDF